jgi:hypothetical protein
MCAPRYWGLAARLRTAAPAISRATRRFGAAQTLVHGDFKAANIITPISSLADSSPAVHPLSASAASPAPASVPAPAPYPAPVVIDWQWCGPGRAAHDVMYLMSTSLSSRATSPEVPTLNP